jgi:hypothetical protein
VRSCAWPVYLLDFRPLRSAAFRVFDSIFSVAIWDFCSWVYLSLVVHFLHMEVLLCFNPLADWENSPSAVISDVKNEILLSWAAGLQLCFSFFLQEVCMFLQLYSLSFFLWNSFCGLFGHFYSVFLRGIASHLLAVLFVLSMSFLLNWRLQMYYGTRPIPPGLVSLKTAGKFGNLLGSSLFL